MDYKNLAQGVFQVQNQVRTNPQSIIPKLEEMLKFFNGSVYRKPGEIPLQTNEGPNAIMECIQALRSTAPVPELQFADGLVKACHDHARDIGPNGACSHSGSDGSTFTDRIERYGDWMGNIAENCEFGSCTPEEIIINLLVDDGNPSRGHRKNILNPKYKVVGIACGLHKGVKHCTVIDYASEYNPKGQGAWNNPPSAFGNEGGFSFGGKPGHHHHHQEPTQPTHHHHQGPSQPRGFTTDTPNFGYGGNVQGSFEVPLTYSTTYQPPTQQQQQQQPASYTSTSYSTGPSSYTTGTGPSSYTAGQQPYTAGPSSYTTGTAPQSYGTAPQTYGAGPTSQTAAPQSYTTGTAPQSYGTGPTSYTSQNNYAPTQSQNPYAPPTNSFNQPPTYANPTYSTPGTNYTTQTNYPTPGPSYTQQPSYSTPQSNPGQAPYTQTNQSFTQNPNGYNTQTTTTSSFSSSSNNTGGDWGSDKFGFPQSTFNTKQFGDRDLLKDPFISEHLQKMKMQTDSSSTNLREMAQKEAPPGANGWSINSSTEIRNGQKYTRVVTTYTFPDGNKKEVVKEFMEGGL